MADEHRTAIMRYAERLVAHAGGGHHVVSALGAWLVLALSAGLAQDGTSREELSEVMGVDAESAFTFAGALLARPHPLIGAAAGVWYQSVDETARVENWRHRLPSSVEAGELPTQGELDR